MLRRIGRHLIKPRGRSGRMHTLKWYDTEVVVILLEREIGIDDLDERHDVGLVVIVVAVEREVVDSDSANFREFADTLFDVPL